MPRCRWRRYPFQFRTRPPGWSLEDGLRDDRCGRNDIHQHQIMAAVPNCLEHFRAAGNRIHFITDTVQHSRSNWLTGRTGIRQQDSNRVSTPPPGQSCGCISLYLSKAGRKPEGTAFTGLTAYPDITQHQLHQPPGNREPQTRTAKASGIGRIGLGKFRKQTLLTQVAVSRQPQ